MSESFCDFDEEQENKPEIISKTSKKSINFFISKPPQANLCKKPIQIILFFDELTSGKIGNFGSDKNFISTTGKGFCFKGLKKLFLKSLSVNSPWSFF